MRIKMRVFIVLKEKIKEFKKIWKQIFFVLLGLIIFLTGAFSGYFYFQKKSQKVLQEDVYLGFISEVYDIIKNNYWQKISDEQLIQLFRLGAESFLGEVLYFKARDKDALQKELFNLWKDKKEKEKKELVTFLADFVLSNLEPKGRSRLYTTLDTQQLKNMVQNVDKNVDLYQVLGVERTASLEKIQEVYQEKTEKLSKEKSQEAKNKLSQLERAYQALKDPTRRAIYDQFGVEPTVTAKIIKPNVLHLKIRRISPTTLDELKTVTEAVDDQEALDSLILDLRGNIGGSLDILPYLLGPFIGPGQYAYELFEHGEYIPFKTQTGWLPSLIRYKRVIILIDENTQSSAELMASVLKKYNVGVLLGTTTRGWGTIEKVFEVTHQIDPKEKYSVFLVRGLTLREDNLPIEGRGVDPLISIKDSNWEKQLFVYFRDQDFIEAVKEVIENY